MYNLDKTHTLASSFQKAEEETVIYWQNATPQECLKASWYLTCQAYGLPYSTDVKMDKTVCSVRKHTEL